MTLFIDEIHKFYSNPQNIAGFEEWRRKKHDDAATQSETQKTETARA